MHGDDFTCTGLDRDLDWIQDQMESHFLCKVNGRLGGDAADLREVRLLNRVIRWGPQGISYEADPRHTEQLVRDLELLGEPSVRSPLTSPGLKRTPESVASATLLPSDRVQRFRALAARANYLALDRPDIAYAAKECCRHMSAPSTLDWAGLVRIVRYLVGRPRLVYDFPWQDECLEVQTHVDTDFAGCVVTRKSTSGGLSRRGAHVLKHWSSTQKTIALSSGEAELAGVVKGAGEGLGLVSLGADLGLRLTLEVHADSSAAIGICRRTGIGKVRHLAVGQLWVQEKVRCGDFRLFKVLGTDNPADILTKAIRAECIHRHLASCGLLWEAGRASTAPEVEGFTWEQPSPGRKSP